MWLRIEALRNSAMVAEASSGNRAARSARAASSASGEYRQDVARLLEVARLNFAKSVMASDAHSELHLFHWYLVGVRPRARDVKRGERRMLYLSGPRL